VLMICFSSLSRNHSNGYLRSFCSLYAMLFDVLSL
jgi:hypothetical protein